MQEAIAAECSSMRWGDFKPKLADALIAHLDPIQVQLVQCTMHVIREILLVLLGCSHPH